VLISLVMCDYVNSVRYKCQLLDFTPYVIVYVSVNMNDSHTMNDMY